ncbi:MAG: hypothetical protein WC471_03395 [Candidatus Woesearchaeota archaeon]
MKKYRYTLLAAALMLASTVSFLVIDQQEKKTIPAQGLDAPMAMTCIDSPSLMMDWMTYNCDRITGLTSREYLFKKMPAYCEEADSLWMKYVSDQLTESDVARAAEMLSPEYLDSTGFMQGFDVCFKNCSDLELLDLCTKFSWAISLLQDCEKNQDWRGDKILQGILRRQMPLISDIYSEIIWLGCLYDMDAFGKQEAEEANRWMHIATRWNQEFADDMNHAIHASDTLVLRILREDEVVMLNLQNTYEEAIAELEKLSKIKVFEKTLSDKEARYLDSETRAKEIIDFYGARMLDGYYEMSYLFHKKNPKLVDFENIQVLFSRVSEDHRSFLERINRCSSLTPEQGKLVEELQLAYQEFFEEFRMSDWEISSITMRLNLFDLIDKKLAEQEKLGR